MKKSTNMDTTFLGNNTLYKNLLYGLWEEEFDISLSFCQVFPPFMLSTLWSTVLWYQNQTSHIFRTFRCNCLWFQGHKAKDVEEHCLETKMVWATKWTFRIMGLTMPPLGGPEALIYNLIHLFVLCFWYMRSSKVWNSSCSGLRISPALLLIY